MEFLLEQYGWTLALICWSFCFVCFLQIFFCPLSYSLHNQFIPVPNLGGNAAVNTAMKTTKLRNNHTFYVFNYANISYYYEYVEIKSYETAVVCTVGKINIKGAMAA